MKSVPANDFVLLTCECYVIVFKSVRRVSTESDAPSDVAVSMEVSATM